MQPGMAQKNIEAIVFASGDPVSISRIAQVLGLDTETVERLINAINDRYAETESPFSLLKLGDQVQMAAREEYAELISAVMEARRNTPLSRAAMETLAVIAYNQPATKALVEQVRGVDSASVVNLLAEKGLVAEAGRLDLPGRPVAYVTTPVFLRSFGLSCLEELPDVEPQDAPDVLEGQLGFGDGALAPEPDGLDKE